MTASSPVLVSPPIRRKDAQTVTSKLLVPETSSEAISMIILHTDRAADLLKRRKIKKELLFKYLHFKRVAIESIADKSVHVNRVLEVWGSSDPGPEPWHSLDDNSLDTPPAPMPRRRVASGWREATWYDAWCRGVRARACAARRRRAMASMVVYLYK